MDNFSHLQRIDYTVQIGDVVTKKVALFNQNKLPTGVAIKCVETDTDNPYLLTMTLEKFQSLFLDDAPLDFPDDEKEVADEDN